MHPELVADAAQAVDAVACPELLLALARDRQQEVRTHPDMLGVDRLDLDVRDDASHPRRRILCKHGAALEPLHALLEALTVIVDDRDFS